MIVMMRWTCWSTQYVRGPTNLTGLNCSAIHVFSIRKSFIRKKYSAARTVKKVQYLIYETEDSCLVDTHLKFSIILKEQSRLKH